MSASIETYEPLDSETYETPMRTTALPRRRTRSSDARYRRMQMTITFKMFALATANDDENAVASLLYIIADPVIGGETTL